MLSERIFFIIEGFCVIVELMMDLDSDVKTQIHNLQLELSRVHRYFTRFDFRDDEPSLLDQRFFMEIDSVADYSDDILADLTRNVHSPYLVAEIRHLVRRIQKSFPQIPLQVSVNQNVVGNINNGCDRQEICSTKLFLGRNAPPRIHKNIRPKSYGHVPNLDIVGFNHELQVLLSHLLSNDKTQAVGIVGMGGSGKTTLAKHIYHHPHIKSHFSLKAWVCISQSWNTRDILQEIFRQTVGATSGVETTRNMSYEEIMERLHTFLRSQSYLIVLDDVWDVSAWNDISPALPICRGSKVLVTTRKINVLKCISLTFLVLKPNPLNDEESYELFWKRMYPDHENPQNMIQNPEVELLLKRCGGLPLAITALAGVLRVDGSQSKWARISETWARKMLNMKNSSTEGVVEEILALSYRDLPHYLKPCVLYLGIFPEDYIIQGQQLIQLWIAEGLIRCPQENEESIAEEYLEEMINRYIIQDVARDETGQVQFFTIHDLIREMIIETANKEGFLKDSHRLVSSFSEFECVKGFDDHQLKWRCIGSVERVLETEKISHVRSHFSFPYFSNSLFSAVKLHQPFQKFTLLRVLILCAQPSSCTHNFIPRFVIPKEIGNLVHLRYLQLNVLSNIELPSAFGNLQNLWTLDFGIPFETTLMPKIFWKMKDLKHLCLPLSGYKVQGEDSGVLNLDRLQGLKTLWNARGGEWMLSEMPKLSPALRKLKVNEIESEEQLNAVLGTPSILFKNLQTLDLHWFGWDVEVNFMNTLCKCESLGELILDGAIRESCKSRIIMFPPNLVKLNLWNTLLKEKDLMGIIDKCCPQLKLLGLEYDAYVGNELVCNAKSFPQLETFTLNGNRVVKRWSIERGAMSNLKHLYLVNCQNLQLTRQGWEFISKVPRVDVKYLPPIKESQFEKDLKAMEKGSSFIYFRFPILTMTFKKKERKVLYLW